MYLLIDAMPLNGSNYEHNTELAFQTGRTIIIMTIILVVLIVLVCLRIRKSKEYHGENE